MKKINTERILLTTLVAVSFFGFLMWTIDQAQSEQDLILNSNSTNLAKNPLQNAVIKITAPALNSEVKSPLTISGQANLEGNKLKIRIKDNKNLILKEGFAQTKDPNKMSDFSIKLAYKKPSATKGTVEIFLVNKEGSEINKILIPVVFKD